MNKHNALIAGVTLAGLGAACSSGLGTGGTNTSSGDPVSARATGLGLDLGLTLAERIEPGYALAGASIPGLTPADDRKIAFIAFSTSSAANNGDGSGTPLVRDAGPPSDNNGVEDVFIVAIEDQLIEMGGMGAHPAAFSRALVNTFRHDRCVTCHAIGATAEPGEELAFPGDPHPGGAEPLTIETCTTCHSGANVPDLQGVEWRAPLESNGDFDFRGNTVQELAMKAMSVSLDDHILNDGRIRWAIESGNVPFVTPRPGGNAGSSALWAGSGRDMGAVPISFELFRAQALAWRDGGFQVTAENSVRDVVLVSESQLSGSAANGMSRRPSLTWVPNPSYDPANPTAERAGDLVIAFESEATNLIVGGSSSADVYRTVMPVFTDLDPSNGAALAGGLDLQPDPGATELISVNSGGSNPGNGPSTSPEIDASGDHIVFVSEATNLIGGFTDGNGGGSDVFYRDVQAASTELVSATVPGGQASGDGTSVEAVISPNGGAIAFSSLATNLVGDDTNGQQDVFVTMTGGANALLIERASVRSDGSEASGAASYAPVVAVGQTGRVSVAFTSDKQDLTAVAAGSNVFLREDGNTTLLSQVRLGGNVALGNGLSSGVSISPTGDSVLYETLASNLDASRPEDGNGESDVVLVDLRSLRSSGNVEGRRITLDSLGQDGDGPSADARIASFRDSIGSFATASFALFRSGSEDLGFTRQDLITTFLNDEDAVIRTDFSADVVAGPPALQVMFNDSSNRTPTAWSWDFGDGDTSTDQNPTHTYTSLGDYDVELTVTRAGGTDSVIKPAFIRVVEPLSITGFTASDTSGPAPLTTTFAATLSGNQEEIEYLWTFGDGNTSTNASPLHTYSTPGTYSVSLMVSGLAGMDTAVETNYITVNVASGANFSFGLGGLEVDFSDTSTGNPTSFSWQFGDGDTSSAENPTHRYDDNGTYMVTLSVNGPGGASQITKTVITNARSFDNIFPRFAANGCNSCHSSGSGSGSLRINVTETSLYNSLVNVTAQGGMCSPSGIRRVRPYNSGSSLLSQVATGSAACNSSVSMGTWSALDRIALVDWINDGAARN